MYYQLRLMRKTLSLGTHQQISIKKRKENYCIQFMQELIQQFVLQGSHHVLKSFPSSYPSAKSITKVNVLSVSGPCPSETVVFPSAIRKIF